MSDQLIAAMNRMASGWGEAMMAVAWQSVLFVTAAALLCLVLRHQSAALRSWVWTAVAAKLLLMPFLSYTITLPNIVPSSPVAATPPRVSATVVSPVRAAGELSTTSYVAETTPMHAVQPALRAAPASLSMAAWIFCGWIAIVGAQLWRVLIQWRNLRAMLAKGHPADGELFSIVARLSQTVGLHRAPRIVTVDENVSPLVCWAWRPVLVLPRELLASTEPSALRQIILHELAHLGRGDLWWCWLPHLARTVYWFHPFVHWVAFQANLERELACDAVAMQTTGTTAGDYARTLVRAASRTVSMPALNNATGHQSSC
jgi:bla regulator protein blaR1